MGLVEVPAGGEAEFLAPMPIARMPGVGEKTEKVLNDLGIRTLGDLAKMPLGSLVDRFGSYGEVLKDHARGIDPRRVEPPAEARSVSNESLNTGGQVWTQNQCLSHPEMKKAWDKP